MRWLSTSVTCGGPRRPRLFLESYHAAPDRIVLDLDATYDPLPGEREGRFFRG